MKFAIIESGGKQYKVREGERVKLEKIAHKSGDPVVFDKILMVGSAEISVGAPYVAGAKVEGRLIKEGRDDKKIIFRYHAKTRYHKKRGHRQPFSEVEITRISR